ncbi:ADP-heptose:LPS heptosyltransferase [Pontibacter ummariensis]|uniref:ADP-heptose:LPS heptosyltransferase n=1 Tax=Pontibacter ummariensis TaxID=1610492 RepID=A0A239FH17_9BACT|nr:glycosyltransferase family 9 protein [Pontibacter ummariensis]PRY12279.1 ADP-heptose:LPS heptosyltransferase [Pontibacter ummariensis]SNS55603.1 ADP-heptose:LPS heptosyltransferase [Pontibacter ummariensis]
MNKRLMKEKTGLMLKDTGLKKVAIFRALQLGDLLCCIPAVRAFKAAYPQAQITLVGLPWAESFVKRFAHYFSGFLCFPGYPGLPEQPFDRGLYIDYLQKSTKENFDLLLQMHGSGVITNPAASMLSARRMGGYYQEGQFKPDEALFMPYPDDKSEVERHLSLMKFLGVPLQGDHLEFPILEEEEQAFSELCSRYELEPQRYVCVHPGARDVKRRWSTASFARVADMMAAKGYKVVLTGSKEEHELAEEMAAAMQHPAVNLAGRTGLGTLGALLKHTRLLFSNDTGVSHVAAAVGAPSVVLFLTSDPARWAPQNRELHKVILRQQIEDTGYVISVVEHTLQEEQAVAHTLKPEELSQGI